MPTEKKRKQVEEIKERLSRCTIAVATDYLGLSANEMTDLRKRLREQGIEYRVIKNTLAWVAADQAGKPAVKSVVQGPTALAFGYGDPVGVARALDDYIRSTRSILAIRGAEMGGRVLSPQDVSTLVRLPSREVLIARLVGQMQGPLAGLVGALNSPLNGLVGILSAPLTALSSLLRARIQQMQGASSER